VGYFENVGGGISGCCLHVFLASMALVLLADGAYLFMVAETMALASSLVTTDHEIEQVRRAGLLYLIVAHRRSRFCCVSGPCSSGSGATRSMPCGATRCR
jgi:hypothetical protein